RVIPRLNQQFSAGVGDKSGKSTPTKKFSKIFILMTHRVVKTVLRSDAPRLRYSLSKLAPLTMGALVKIPRKITLNSLKNRFCTSTKIFLRAFVPTCLSYHGTKN